MAPAGAAALVVELAPPQAYGAIDAARRAGFARVRYGARPGRPAAHAGGGPMTRVVPAAETGATAPRPPTALADGAVVAVPTDTVYGLAVDPAQPDAVAAAVRAQGPPGRRGRCPSSWPGRSRWPWWPATSSRPPPHLADRYWPGPLTLVVPRRPGFTVDLGGPPAARQTVGVRRPDHPVVVALCELLGPLAVTSANLHGAPSGHRRPTEVAAVFAGSRPARASCSTAGTCDGVPSTVVECRGPASRVPARGGAGLGRPARTSDAADRERRAAPAAAGVDGAGPDGRHWRDAARRVVPTASTVIIID